MTVVTVVTVVKVVTGVTKNSSHQNKISRKKNAFVKTNFFTKKLVYKKMFSPKIVFDQIFFTE